MGKKQRIKEKIYIDLDGIQYEGTRTIEGKRKLDQYVSYKGNCISDLKGYPPDQRDTLMLSVARLILIELVTGRTISSQPCTKYGL